MNNQPIQEESLDPQDWDAMKALGHQMVDDMMDYFATSARASRVAAHARRCQSPYATAPAPRTPGRSSNL